MLVNVTVIGGPSSQELAKKLSRKIKATFVKSELRVFPDGEGKITLNSVPKRGKIIIVQSLFPPVDSNLVYLLSLISKARKFSKNISVVIPYMGYARQDREFLPGEIITISVISKLINSVGATKLLVTDIHSKIALDHFTIPTKNVSAIPLLANHIKKMKLKNPIVISPDQGGKNRALEFAKSLNADCIALEKQRNRKTGKVKIISTNLQQVKNRDLILVDDMISTGDSIIKASKFLKKQKCKRIFVVCTHALLINDAEDKIKKSGVTKIISTNSILGKTSLVDISGIISDEIL